MERKANSTLIEKRQAFGTDCANYQQVSKEIINTWPQWKKNVYDNNFATSNHVKKILK